MARLFATDDKGNAKMFHGRTLDICWLKCFAYEARRGFNYVRLIEEE